jgi:predicted ArsR family transcriptional regulator
LYEYVRRQDHPVTREEAADAQRISRNLAAFHLDKLVEVGLLRATYPAPPGEPRGRGRTPKAYSVTGPDLSLTIPERRYELVGEILADAVAESPDDASAAGLRIARTRGQQIGADLRAASDGPREDSIEQEVGYACQALAVLGFEPRVVEGRTRLRNCPFHALAVRQPALICGLNEAFVTGLLAGIGTKRLTARLAPAPGECCVELSA